MSTMNSKKIISLSEFLSKNKDNLCNPTIICIDGFSISIQAGVNYYCSPRANTSIYTSVEAGFPNQGVPSLYKYKDNKNNLDTASVFVFVPVEVIQTLLDTHGGIDYDLTFDI